MSAIILRNTLIVLDDVDDLVAKEHDDGVQPDAALCNRLIEANQVLIVSTQLSIRIQN